MAAKCLACYRPLLEHTVEQYIECEDRLIALIKQRKDYYAKSGVQTTESNSGKSNSGQGGST